MTKRLSSSPLDDLTEQLLHDRASATRGDVVHRAQAFLDDNTDHQTTSAQSTDRFVAHLFGCAVLELEIRPDELSEALEPVISAAPDAGAYIAEKLPQAIENLLLTLWFEALSKACSPDGTPGRREVGKIEKLHKLSMRERVKARGRGSRLGDYRKWTIDRCVQFLKLYETTLERVQRAKDLYRKNKSASDWTTIVKRMDRTLPQWVIERLPLRGERPSEIARELAAELFGVDYSSYLKRVIKRARDAQQKPERHTLRARRSPAAKSTNLKRRKAAGTT